MHHSQTLKDAFLSASRLPGTNKINNRFIGNLFTHKIGQFFRLFRTDDAMEDCGFLKFTDTSMKATFLQTLSTMRKNRLFCDVIINVSLSFSQFYLHSKRFGAGNFFLLYLFIGFSNLVNVKIAAACAGARVQCTKTIINITLFLPFYHFIILSIDNHE